MALEHNKCFKRSYGVGVMGRIVPVLHPMHKTVTAVIAHAYDDSQHTS